MAKLPKNRKDVYPWGLRTTDNVINVLRPEPVKMPMVTRMPIVYDFKTLAKVELSVRERAACDLWLESGNCSEVARQLKDKFPNRGVSGLTVRRWLERPHIQGYLKSRVEDSAWGRGMTKEKWERESIEYRDGVKKADSTTFLFHKLIGMARGYLVEQKSQVNLNQEIRFTQQDGTV